MTTGQNWFKIENETLFSVFWDVWLSRLGSLRWVTVSRVWAVDKQLPQADRGRTGTNGDHRRFINGSSLHRYPTPIEPVLSSVKEYFQFRPLNASEKIL
jgi:hypothetical protein